MTQDDYFPFLHHHNRLLAIVTSNFFTLKFCFDLEPWKYCSHPKNDSERCQISLHSKFRLSPGSAKRKHISEIMKIVLLGAGHVILHRQTVGSEGIMEEIIPQYQMSFWNLNMEYGE